MRVTNYEVICGVPLTSNELITIVRFFANTQGSEMHKSFIRNSKLQQVSVDEVINGLYRGEEGPEELDINYADEFDVYLSCLYTDLKKFNCDVVTAWENRSIPANANTPYTSHYTVPIVIIGVKVTEFSPERNDNPPVIKLTTILPFTFNQLIATIFPQELSLQMSTRYDTYLVTQGYY
jgi:hypothetical protein